jgi:hypothetical protein
MKHGDAIAVHGHGWAGIKNGELLRRAHGECDVFVTLDRNLEFQQNLKILRFGVVVVRSLEVGPGSVATVAMGFTLGSR